MPLSQNISKWQILVYTGQTSFELPLASQLYKRLVTGEGI